MKTRNIIRNLAVLGACVGGALPSLRAAFEPAVSGVTPISLTTTGTTESFSSFTGTSSTVPTGFYVESDAANPQPWRAEGDGSSGTAGFWSYRTSGTERAFGILEDGSVLSNARIYLKMQNSGTAAVSRVFISYDVEQWREGARYNRIRLKYNPTSGTNGYSSLADLIDTPAPVNTGTTTPLALDGNANKASAKTLLILQSSIPATTGTGFFRWQYSSTGDEGTTRDGLAIDNVTVKSVPLGVDRTWVGGPGNWNTTSSSWSSGTWSNTSNYNGVLSTGTGTLTVVEPIEATDLSYTTNNYTVTSSGTNPLRINGAVNVNASVLGTLSANVLSSTVYNQGLIKIGTGTLALTGTNSISGGLNIIGGAVRIDVDNAVPSTNEVRITEPSSLLVSAGKQLTVTGIQSTGTTDATSGTNAKVDLANSGTLIINPSGGSSEFKGSITGSNGLVQIGVSGTAVGANTSVQRFQSKVKAYTSPTVINNGTLEVSELGAPNSTSSITVNGPVLSGTNDTPNPLNSKGELLLTTDTTAAVSYTLAAASTISVKGGNLSAKRNATGTNSLTLTNNVLVDRYTGTEANNGYDNRIYSSGTNTKFVLSGVVSGSGNWRKQGQGVLLLSNAANTYTGTLNVNNGTVESSGAQALGNNSPVFFGDPDQAGRKLLVRSSVSIGGLEGNSPDLISGTLPPQTATLELNNGSVLTVNQAPIVSGTTETKPSYQGDLIKSGTGTAKFVKSDYGTTRFTRYPKNFTGGLIDVNNGVLQVSFEGQPKLTSTGTITVNGVVSGTGTPSGQLRLSSGGTATPLDYNFGGPIVLKSCQRGLNAVVIAGNSLGEQGGLRLDADASLGEKFASVSSPIQIAASSDIHVNGTTAVLTISGTFSGTGALNRTGGGTVNLTGNTATYTGTTTLTNGTTQLNTGGTYGGSIVTTGTSNPVLAVSGTSAVSGLVNIVGATTFKAVGPTTLLNVTGNVSLGTPLNRTIIDLNSAFVTTGTYKILKITGAGLLAGSGTLTNAPVGSTLTVDTTLKEIRVAIP